MQDDHNSGYHRNRALLRHGAKLAFDLDDHALGHGVIDLCRAARREISAIGLKDGSRDLPIDSFEGALLYRLMPEIARRLISKGDAQLLLLKGERPGGDVTNISPDRLRRYVGNCLAKSRFAIISEKVRDRFDPQYACAETFFANEAINQDVRSGNILEIALNRVAPAPALPDSSDTIAKIIHEWAAACEFPLENATWSPELPEYCHDHVVSFSALREDAGAPYLP